ncbi:MAG TPA: hypothetical protein VF444_20130 [Pseudonocardiaceae bacterium]
MTGSALSTLAATGLTTSAFSDWLLKNIVPLVLLGIALLLLWLGGSKGDNAGVMRRIIGVFVALAIIGLAVTGAGVNLGTWLANLFTS